MLSLNSIVCPWEIWNSSFTPKMWSGSGVWSSTCRVTKLIHKISHLFLLWSHETIGIHAQDFKYVSLLFLWFNAAYKQDQKGKRVAAADRRKQKAMAAQTAASNSSESQSQDSSTTAQVSSPHAVAATTAGATGTADSPVVVGNNSLEDGGNMAEGSAGAGSEKEEEPMETDSAVGQTSAFTVS